MQMTYIMSCVWLDYMVKYFQCKNCVGSSPKTKKCVASFLVPGDTSPQAAYRLRRLFYKSAHFAASPFPKKVMLRLRCSLVNALLTVSLATNLLQVYVSINFFDGIFFITSLHF